MSELISADDMSDWMSKLPEPVWELSLSEIVIPGSHNSFSYRLDPGSELAPDANPALKLLGNGIIYKWAVTQDLSFKEQLELGVRYFDLRVAFRKKTQNVHFCHSLYGMTVEDGIKEILDFLKEHPKEIAILDFNHIFDMTEERHSEFINKLIEICGSKMCMYVGIESLTLSMLWENNVQVIIIYHYDKVESESGNLWPGKKCIRAPWAQTANIPRLLEFLSASLNNRDPGLFHVSQCVLTPDAGFLLGHLMGSLKNDLAKKVIPETVNWLKETRRKLNIVMADYVELNNFVKEVVMFNFKE
ncbi:PI-PLC X domain-containing protein 2-like [Dreissena polymorpha]|uniref:Phosphatidylinositol-specific phospholipase C X domain-containing protein n=1 Tax=Dreissena polymorpha TaxID=45954 RepID=A0A9D4MA53_DREPO|nr:PI-PLC X domain-containing protein 2-like [Dreissena polymorpha]KAH3872539.1 hypothetical protein DPMN_035757 [Dreissena polymorpha]